METREFEAIDQFLNLASVGKADLWDYYGVGADASVDALDEVIKKRRTWAQGQQSNPKYRPEALWLIKNMALVRRALIEERDAYQDELDRRAQQRNQEKLDVFIEGTLADGKFNSAKEIAIREQGARLGLPDAVVTARIQHARANAGTLRSSGDLPPTPEGVVDYYELLEVPADVGPEALEEAYRGRYRWARSLTDTRKASEIYEQLDEAWRVLKDPERRAEYDERRRDFMLKLERHAAGESGEFFGFLPPPPKRRPGDARPQQESSRAEPDGGVPGDGEATVLLLPQEAKVSHEPPPVLQTPPPSRAAAPPRGPSSAGLNIITSPTQPAAPSPLRQPPPAQPAQAAQPAPAPAPSPPDVPQSVPVGGPFQPSRRKLSPKLEMDGPENQRVKAGSEPLSVQFVVRNAGQGQMSGRVLSDRDWVQVSPTRLDPLKREQVIEARIVPAQMPRRQARSMVTVVADHGERRTVSIDVERRLLSPTLAIFIGVVVLAAASVVAVLSLVE